MKNETKPAAAQYSNWIADLKKRWCATQIKAAVAVNFALTMPAAESDLARQFVRDPQVFEVFGLREQYNETQLKAAIAANIERTLLSLGRGVSFLGREYPAKPTPTEKKSMIHLNPSSPRSPTAPAPSTPSLAASATSPNAIGNWKVKLATLVALATFAIAPAARAEQPAYTNHAGNVVSGVVVALDARTTTISNATETAALPLSIFPESERRRIAADFGQPRVPAAVRRAVEGAEKAIARSRKRAEKGLCPQEESDAFCDKTEAALRSYLDRQVESGAITPAERTALGW